jgi:hypothetical protein
MLPKEAREFGINYGNKVKQLVRAIPGGVANPSEARAKGELAVGLCNGTPDLVHWGCKRWTWPGFTRSNDFPFVIEGFV